jgi:hypothetical protein
MLLVDDQRVCTELFKISWAKKKWSYHDIFDLSKNEKDFSHGYVFNAPSAALSVQDEAKFDWKYYSSREQHKFTSMPQKCSLASSQITKNLPNNMLFSNAMLNLTYLKNFLSKMERAI